MRDKLIFRVCFDFLLFPTHQKCVIVLPWIEDYLDHMLTFDESLSSSGLVSSGNGKNNFCTLITCYHFSGENIFCEMKKAIRKEILKIRDNIPQEIRSEKDACIKKQLFLMHEFFSAQTILFYASFRSEVETHSMIEESLRMGKKVVLPSVDKQKHALVLYELKDMKELTPGYMGIPEPSVSDERIIDINEVDLVIIPGAAFDYSGNRLGYGAGYYDILLSHRKKRMPIIALAYEEQLVDSIPAEEHDVRVDMIVTDQRIVSAKKDFC